MKRDRGKLREAGIGLLALLALAGCASGGKAARPRAEETPAEAETVTPAATGAAESERYDREGKLAPEAPAEAAAPDWQRVAEDALAVGDSAKALEASAQALLAAPEDIELVLLRARALEASGDWFAAQRVADALARQAPDEPRAWLFGARLSLEQAANPADSLRRCQEAAQRFPGNADVLELAGRALLSLGRQEEALATWREILEREPSRVSTLRLLALDAAARRQWSEARQLSERIPADAQTPDDLDLAWNVAWQLDDRSEALAIARELAARRPGSASGLALARSLAGAGQRAEALAEAERWLAQMAQSPAEAADTASRVRSGLLSLRGALRAADDPQAALDDLRAALIADPDNLDALLMLADLLDRAGEPRKALGYLKHAAEISSDPKLQGEARALEARVQAGP